MNSINFTDQASYLKKIMRHTLLSMFTWGGGELVSVMIANALHIHRKNHVIHLWKACHIEGKYFLKKDYSSAICQVYPIHFFEQYSGCFLHTIKDPYIHGL